MSQTGNQPTPTPTPSPTPTPTPTPEPTPTPTPTPTPSPAPAPQPIAALEAKDIVVPEGFEVDDKIKTDFVGILNDASLDRKSLAAKLIELQAGIARAASEKGSELVRTQWATWEQESRADPEVGGAKLEENLGNIARLIDTFGGVEKKDAAGNILRNPDGSSQRDASKLREVLDSTGVGNHVEFVRFFSNVAAQLVKEGKMPPAGAPSAAAPKDAAGILYPSMKQ